MRASTLALGLVILNLAVYSQVAGFEFTYLDDDKYVFENEAIQGGLAARGMRYAFSTEPAPNSNPLAWVSHMLDVELFGLHPGAHHLSSLVLHILNTVMLFYLFAYATARRGAAFVVAAYFAIHPVHVESVVWIADRKDVLSAAFWIPAVFAYCSYADSGRKRSLWLAALLFLLSLLAKPMAVTLPFVLLLLDLWPLRRLEPTWRSLRGSLHLLTEKIPLFVLATLACAGTWYLQNSGGAVQGIGQIPVVERMGNAVAAYGTYLSQSVYPVGLGIYYPLTPGGAPAWAILRGAFLLMAGTAASLVLLRRSPWFFVGWFWFVGMLVPVIGLVQIGGQAHADRYTYLPFVGISVVLVYGIAESRWARSPRGLAYAAAGVTIAVLAVMGYRQTARWQNSERLFTHTLEVGGESLLIRNNLGRYYLHQDDLDRAHEQFLAADAISPGRLTPNYNLAFIAFRRGEHGRAVEMLEALVNAFPEDFDTQLLLSKAYLDSGRVEDAAAHAALAQALRPASVEAKVNLGLALARQGRGDEALYLLEVAAISNPGHAGAQMNFANFLARRGRVEEALAYYGKALALEPGNGTAHYNAGAAHERMGRAGEARAAYERALELEPDLAIARQRLDILKARDGDAP